VRRVDEALVRISDSGGRPRGLAFPVDHQGTLLTSHEAVDGLASVLLTWPAGAVRRLAAAEVVPLPEYDLALLRTDAVLPPLPLAGGGGTRLVALPGAGRVLQGGVVGPVTARYAAAERWHLVADVWQLDVAQAPNGLPVELSGAPVLDAETGAVVAVATAALRCDRRGTVLAVPLRAAAGHPAVADLLSRNAVAVPAYGRALNLAGVLELAAATLSGLGPTVARRVARSDAPPAEWSTDRPVLAVVGAPGTGRTTELAALAVRRTQAAHRLPTVWLRGADLLPGDRSLLDAVDRALDLSATGAGRATAEQACRLAAAGHRPLLVVLDGPEEMPPALQPELADWTVRTGSVLRQAGARLLIGCRPEFWEQQRFAAEDLQPPHLLGDLPVDTAAEVARRAGLRPGPRHPLTLGLLAEIRAAAPGIPAEAAPTRAELLGASLDLSCLRIAERLADGAGGSLGTAGRRGATAVAGRVHEAARRMLGPGAGALGRADFDEIFPDRWGPAVLAEGLLTAAGPGFRFVHEEFSEWIQGSHLDLPVALAALLGERPDPTGPPVAVPPPGSHRRGGPRGHAVPAPQPPPTGIPIPHHRIGPVREALLRLAGTHALDSWLGHLVLRLDGPEAAGPGSDAHWWAAHLLASVLLGLQDATAQLPLLRSLAARMAARPVLPIGFWTALPLPVPVRVDLLRELARSGDAAPLDAVAGLLRDDPQGTLPALCRWLKDGQLAATALQLLRTHRRVALDDLAEALVDTAHPRADALLRELADIEPSALCRAVDRWAHDPRPQRHVAAAVHAPAVRPTTPADRALLRYAAEAMLARSEEQELHGAALALLVADPDTRSGRLPTAVARYVQGDPHLTPASLAPALDSHSGLVLSAYHARLHQPGEEAAAILCALGATPAPHARTEAARMVADYLLARPEAAAQVAAWLEARARHGSAERATLLRFVAELDAHPRPVRDAFARALEGAPGDGLAVHRELLALLRRAEPMQGGDQPHGRL
jgi:predicted ATPase